MPPCVFYCPRGGGNLPFPCNFASHHRKTLLQSCKSVSHHCIGRCTAAKWPRIVAKGIYTNAKRPASSQGRFAALFHIRAMMRGTIARLFRRLFWWLWSSVASSSSAGIPHLFPFRTEKLSPLTPMILH